MNDEKNMTGMVSEKVQACDKPRNCGRCGWYRCGHEKPVREAAPSMSATDLKQAQRIAEGLGLSEEASRLGRAANERMQACGDGFCDRAAREQAKMNAAFYERLRSDEAAGTTGAPIGLDAFLATAENAKNPQAREGSAVERAKAQARKALEQKEAATAPGRLGFQGPRGFVPYPEGGGLNFEEWSAAMVREANVDSLQAEMDRAAMLGGYGGIAQQSKAPGKQFSRSDILAILRAQRAVAGNVADSEYQKLLTIFENLE